MLLISVFIVFYGQRDFVVIIVDIGMLICLQRRCTAAEVIFNLLESFTLGLRKIEVEEDGR